ncbi:hypothetical protein Sgly_0749 [Syntrophobotulus glycolicus DSM 8271]|uniref:Uncharacterized protein n=1 Tax=Syntrophobotulus glycolicus (strain DSM 8271 / FlGlyR) TaxID=645991 RepID=F0T0P1_SYNGF|nr:hypothetical protein [Syntrophobotulus glycolicus]ADY55106.1 hypothetical protein Sgly_0749 [Syntrophobotulus glycolicus DSM 8271]
MTNLNRESNRVSEIKVQIAKTDLQVECLKDVIIQKQEEAQAMENEIALLQGKYEGVREIMNFVQKELEIQLNLLVQLRKKGESLEKKDTETLATTQYQEAKSV